MKISVIMASYLGQYNGCASNRVDKFKRAIDSFIYQTYSNCELIIIADGCDITEDLYNSYYINSLHQNEIGILLNFHLSIQVVNNTHLRVFRFLALSLN